MPPAPPQRSANAASAADPIGRLLKAFCARKPMRAGSVIITIFGDAILPRGGDVMLGGLIDLLGQFRINESQVRTALSRLVSEGWLEAIRLGRRSQYRLTESGERRFSDATQRIYFGPKAGWRGEWSLVMLAPVPQKKREDLRKELGWLGFGSIAANICIHPSPDRDALNALIEQAAHRERPLVIHGEIGAPIASEGLRTLVADAWNFAKLAKDYRDFIREFTPLRDALRQGLKPSATECLLARLMLIHDYRRIILRDPALPPDLMPENWIGRDAYALTRDIYGTIANVAEAWIDTHLEGPIGPLSPAGTAFRSRFSAPI